jgi:hypothetical protein
MYKIDRRIWYFAGSIPLGSKYDVNEKQAAYLDYDNCSEFTVLLHLNLQYINSSLPRSLINIKSDDFRQKLINSGVLTVCFTDHFVRSQNCIVCTE